MGDRHLTFPCTLHVTKCALIFTGFNVHGFCRLAAICNGFCKGFRCKNLDVDEYAQYNGMMTAHKEKCCLCRAVTIIEGK